MLNGKSHERTNKAYAGVEACTTAASRLKRGGVRQGCTDRHTYRHTQSHTDTHRHRHRDTDRHRQTDTHTHTQTHAHTHRNERGSAYEVEGAAAALPLNTARFSHPAKECSIPVQQIKGRWGRLVALACVSVCSCLFV